jgi:hypothetical protein
MTQAYGPLSRTLYPNESGDLHTTARHRTIARISREREMTSLIGMIVLNADVLTTPNAFIGPCKVNGKIVSWSLWAPHKRLLVDVFKKELPTDDEIMAKSEFAEKHRLRYAIVPPGRTFGLDDLKQLLAKEAA